MLSMLGKTLYDQTSTQQDSCGETTEIDDKVCTIH